MVLDIGDEVCKSCARIGILGIPALRQRDQSSRKEKNNLISTIRNVLTLQQNVFFKLENNENQIKRVKITIL